MSVRCARPGCGEIATTRMLFDATATLVVLDAKVAEWGGSGVLCSKHADRMTVPKGWTIDDRRVQAPRLFPIARFEEPGRVIGRSTAAAKARRLSPVAADSSIADVPADTDFDEVDEVDGVPVHPNQGAFELPDERTPLLARAFGSSMTRRPASGINALIPGPRPPATVTEAAVG